MPRSLPDIGAPQSAGGQPASPGTAFARSLPWLLLIGGMIGAGAAFVLTVEKIRLLTDSAYVPSCSINPILSCGSVMTKPQAEAFGFPNPLIGIAGFAIVATIGAAMLAGATFRRWFWLGLQAGTVFGIAFVTWLMIQSLYSIGALCPYCMIVWAVIVPIFIYVTLYNIDHGALPLTRSVRPAAQVLVRYHTVIVTCWFLIIITLILIRFWDYWSSLFR